MRKEFTSINYLGGLAKFTETNSLKVIVDTNRRQVIFENNSSRDFINFENIDNVSYDNKKARSGGKAAAGAIVGGLLTGGIGLLAGAAIGGRKKDASLLSITHKHNGHLVEAYFSGKTSELYAFLSSAIMQAEPLNLDKKTSSNIEPITAYEQLEKARSSGVIDDEQLKKKMSLKVASYYL